MLHSMQHERRVKRVLDIRIVLEAPRALLARQQRSGAVGAAQQQLQAQLAQVCVASSEARQEARSGGAAVRQRRDGRLQLRVRFNSE